MIRVRSGLFIDERDLSYAFIRAAGPGGQNVNKVATAVQLRYDPDGCEPLPEPVREQLRRIAGTRMTSDGTVVITARRHRSQERNRREAIDRLVALIRRAAGQRRRRKPTRPPASARERRLARKHHRSRTKQRRHPVSPDE